MFWSFHALADKTNNGPFPKPFFGVNRRSNGLICKRKYAFWLLIFAKSVLKPLNYLIAAAAPINTNGLLLYYKTQEQEQETQTWHHLQLKKSFQGSAVPMGEIHLR